jgi:hypothetical protein
MKFALFSLPRSVATFMEDATVVVAGFSVGAGGKGMLL